MMPKKLTGGNDKDKIVMFTFFNKVGGLFVRNQVFFI